MNNETPSPAPPEDDKDLSGLGRDLLGGSTSPAGTNPKTGWQPPTVEELHAILPQYEVSRMLGRGGMGAVYMGRQISLDRPVAIKILSGALEEDDFGFKERFKNEARAMAKLSHPGIIAVHDFGETADGLLYIVMEYVDGTDVARMIAAEGRLHTEHAMAITAHVCDALAYAHARGIIHRDIKPANIMVGYDGVVKVADFGLAKVHAGEGQTLGLTMSGMAMGTMHFIAPEALEYGATVDHRADLYAVGVMLFQMLTGKLPQGMFRMPSLQVPGMDPRYDGIITRAMYEDREERYQSAGELRADLDGILTQPVEKVEAEDTKPAAALPTMARPQRPGGRKKVGTGAKRPVPEKAKSRGWGVWAAVIVLCGGGAAAWMYLGRDESIVSKPVEQGSAPPTADRVESPTTPSSASTAVSLASAPAMANDEPFVNSLGMKFVPVPGTDVLFCIHETRRKDYATYALEMPNVDALWKSAMDGNLPCGDGDDHPAVHINWDDAKGFCAWLSKREGKTYRLPTDKEWSYAVGVGPKEFGGPDITPEMMSMKVQGEYPWGGSWPPMTAERAGNYLDITRQKKVPSKTWIEDYEDGFASTAPVMSFKPNQLGIFDLGGNVNEWVEEWYNSSKTFRTFRGAAFKDDNPGGLLSSFRLGDSPGHRALVFGCRVVLELPNLVAFPNTSQVATNASIPATDVPSIRRTDSFTNTLGMKFVPVPITGGLTDGKPILFSIWETRVQDYEAFVAATKRAWQKPNFSQESSHPVVQMNVEDAEAFCSWLTELDRKSGKIRTTELYRLPTDHEWSCAVGLGDLENPTSSPGQKGNKITDVYPWGSVYPPSQNSGNFGGAEFLPDSGKSRKDSGHNDAHVETAPVGSYTPNKFGIFDLGGNAWEWVDDKFDAAKKEGVLRGASFFDSGFGALASSHRSPRDQVFRHWTFGFRVVLAAANALPGNAGSAAAGTSATAPTSAATPEEATKEKPFTNSLGMKFVPVPGTEVLFCLHETRYRDYAAYAGESPRIDQSWKNQKLDGYELSERPDEHPIVGVNLDDARAFSEWLSKKEGKTYRIPTDKEWSYAAGVGNLETWSPGTTPLMMSQKIPNVWPWGNEWPPPIDGGNVSDQSRKSKAPKDGARYVENFDDGFPTTAPVMSFRPNRLGIHDLGGNVWEWCEDWQDNTNTKRVLRGGCWANDEPVLLLSSHRHGFPPTNRGAAHGFRLVLEAPATSEPQSATVVTIAPVAPTAATTAIAPSPQNLPEVLTRIANYQKARHSQLSDLTEKYHVALVSAKETATKSGVLDEVVTTDSAITAAASLAELIEKNLAATEVAPLPPLAPLSETASPRLKELRDIFVGEISKIELNLVTGLEKSLAAVQVPLVQAGRYDEAKTLDTYREEMLKRFQTPAESLAPAPASPAAAVSSEARILQNAVVIKDVLAFPKLILMPDGSLIAIISNQPSKNPTEGDLDCYASRDGLKWEKRSTVTRHEPDTIRMNHAAGLAKNGDLLVLCGGWTNLKQPQRPKQAPFRDAELRPWIMRSSDGGRTWSKSETFPSTESGEWSEHIPFGSIRAADDGTLRVSTYQGQYADPATSTRTNATRAWSFRSNDDGLSWEPQAIISELHSEVDLFPLGGKSWLAAARTTNLDLIRSEDDGAIWSAPVPVTARSEINGHLIRLADGRLLLSYGVRVRGSEGVSAKLSSDEGRTWSSAVRLADGLKPDSGYPSSVQLQDGKIVTAYYSQGAPEYDGYHMGVTVWEMAVSSSASATPKP